MIKWLALVLIIKGLLSCGDANAAVKFEPLPGHSGVSVSELISYQVNDTSQRTVWVKWEYAGGGSTVSREQFNCGTKEFRTLGFRRVSSSGEVVRKTTPSGWGLAFPGQLPSDVMDYACSFSI